MMALRILSFGQLWRRKATGVGNERMDLVDRFYKLFPDAEVAYLTGDREFVGSQMADLSSD